MMMKKISFQLVVTFLLLLIFSGGYGQTDIFSLSDKNADSYKKFINDFPLKNLDLSTGGFLRGTKPSQMHSMFGVLNNGKKGGYWFTFIDKRMVNISRYQNDTLLSSYRMLKNGGSVFIDYEIPYIEGVCYYFDKKGKLSFIFDFKDAELNKTIHCTNCRKRRIDKASRYASLFFSKKFI